MSSASSPDDADGANGPAAVDFSPLGIAIPTESLLDDDFLSSLNFSKRGSLMFDPDTVDTMDGAMDRMSLTEDDRSATPTQPSSILPRPASSATSYAADDDAPRALVKVASPTPDIRVMTPDVEQESQKVRQLYASGDVPGAAPAPGARETVRHSFCERLEPTPEVLTEDDDSVPYDLSSSLAPAAAQAAPAPAPVSGDCTDSCLSSPQKRKIIRTSFVRSKIRRLFVSV